MSNLNLEFDDSDRDLQELIEGYCHGNLSADQQDRLNRRLAEDPAALEKFVVSLEFHSRLRRWALRASEAKAAFELASGEPAGNEPAGGSGSLALGGRAVSSSPVAPHSSSELNWPTSSNSSIWGHLESFFKNPFSFVGVTLTVLLMAAIFVAGGAWGAWWHARAVPEAPIQVADVGPPITPVAYLTLATGCDWGKGSAQVQFVGSAVNLGETLTLLEGIAEFRLSSGVSLSIEGPASLVMASPTSLVLQQGTLTAHIPWKAADFQILAGTNRLTALDAEFGVQAKGSSVAVHVFSGEVVAAMSPYFAKKESGAFLDDEAGAESDVASSPLSIKQSEAVELISSPDGKTTARHFAASPEQFASRTTMVGQLPITAGYVEAVKKSGPVAYWRFEGVENGQIRNEIATGCPLKVTTDIPLRGDEANRVLESGYAFDKDNLVSTEAMDAYFNGDFTVEVWIKPSHYHRGTIISVMDKSYPPSNLDKDEYNRQFAKCGFGYRLEVAPDFGFVPGTLQSVLMDPSQKRAADNCYSENNLYKIRRWQHVVALRGSWGTQLYFDGQRVAAAKSRQKATLAEGQPLVVGRVQSFENERPFVGQMDELAIYDRVLSPAEILEHYKAVNEQTSNKQARRPKVPQDS